MREVTLMASTRVHDHRIISCKFSPNIDGVVLCTTSSSETPFGPGALNVYRYSQDGKIELLNSIAWDDALLDTCWSTAQKDLAITACSDSNIHLWRVFNQEWLPSTSFAGHTGPTTSVQCVENGNSEKILSGSLDKTFKIWDIEHQAAVLTQKFEEEVLQSLSSPLLPHLIVSVLEGKKLGLSDDRCNPKDSHRFCLEEQILSCDWSPHVATRLALSSSSGNVLCLDIRYLSSVKSRKKIHCHLGPVRRVRWLPAFYDIVVSVGFDGVTALTDISDGSILERVRHHSNWVYDVDCSPFHPNLLADCSWDSLLHVFEPRSLLNRPIMLPRSNKL